MTVIDIAICADKNHDVGLHVTLYSLMYHLDSDFSAKFHFFLDGYSQNDLDRIKYTLDTFSDRYEFHNYGVTDFNLGKGKGLHGNKLSRLTFHGPQIVNSDKLLFLDADLLILTSVSDLFNEDLMGRVAGAVGKTTVKYCNETEFLQGLGIAPDAKYFNAGVLAFDCNLWKSQNFTEKCLNFVEEHHSKFHSADQTVLNAVLQNQVAFLDGKYNRSFYPGAVGIGEKGQGCICHFVGSPKPWDFLGEYLHQSYPFFQKYLQQTAYAEYKSYKDLSLLKAKRTFMLSNSYYKAFRATVMARS